MPKWLGNLKPSDVHRNGPFIPVSQLAADIGMAWAAVFQPDLCCVKIDQHIKLANQPVVFLFPARASRKLDIAGTDA